jgi:hypothetical protein
MKRGKKTQSSDKKTVDEKPNALKRNFSDRTESAQSLPEQSLKRSKNDSAQTANTLTSPA